MGIKKWILPLLGVFFINALAEEQSSRDSVEVNYDAINATRVLSRRKRFIVFPDGSSFQLVFCTQNQGYIQVGDIVWFGNTAALAWELPSDPKLFHILKGHTNLENGQRRQDIGKHITYVDERGRVIAKVPYRRKPIINPAFAKRSVDNVETKHNHELSNSTVDRMSIERMHRMHHEGNRLRCLDPEECNVEFHRAGRKALYEKLETFFDALGMRGRQCVLRLLCESSRHTPEQGTFVDEIVRAVFTLPNGRAFGTDYHNAYDEAHMATGDCGKLFPECDYEDPESLL